jgi:hypothetical protein
MRMNTRQEHTSTAVLWLCGTVMPVRLSRALSQLKLLFIWTDREDILGSVAKRLAYYGTTHKHTREPRCWPESKIRSQYRRIHHPQCESTLAHT